MRHIWTKKKIEEFNRPEIVFKTDPWSPPVFHFQSSPPEYFTWAAGSATSNFPVSTANSGYAFGGSVWIHNVV